MFGDHEDGAYWEEGAVRPAHAPDGQERKKRTEQNSESMRPEQLRILGQRPGRVVGHAFQRITMFAAAEHERQYRIAGGAGAAGALSS